jgi:hypothetical protein
MMKYSCMVSGALFALSAAAWGQTATPQQPQDSKAPADSAVRRAPDASKETPSDPGAIVVPPKIDPAAVATPPANIDPEISDATKDIDRNNRKKSKDKQKPRSLNERGADSNH